MLLSVVLPAYNEEQNIPNTAKVLARMLEENAIDYELVFISDGSRDATFEQIRGCHLRRAEAGRRGCRGGHGL